MAVNTVNIFCKCLLRINRALLMNKDLDLTGQDGATLHLYGVNSLS